VPYQKAFVFERPENGGGGTNGWVDGFVAGQVAGACASSVCCIDGSKQSNSRTRGNIDPRVGR
jgi:hypothetical protein